MHSSYIRARMCARQSDRNASFPERGRPKVEGIKHPRVTGGRRQLGRCPQWEGLRWNDFLPRPKPGACSV